MTATTLNRPRRTVPYDRTWTRMDRYRAAQRRIRRRITWTAVAVVCGGGYTLVTGGLNTLLERGW